VKNNPLPNPPISETADSKEALEFVRGLQKEYYDKRPVDQQAFVEQYLDRFTRGELRGIGRRILMDILKRPQISTEAGPAPAPSGRAARRRTTARSRSTTRRRPAREP
jgi:hypothetical protein